MFENKNLNIFTIGHSNYSINEFSRLLKKFDINILIDVRSSPYSKHVPHFNRDFLMKKLSEYGIRYFFFGDKLGARYHDSNLLYKDGKVNFKKVRLTQNFNHGIERLLQIAQNGDKIVIMCSEKDPFDCHRFSLVSYQLMKKGINVKHISENGDFIYNNELEERLLKRYKIDCKQSTLYGIKTKEEALEEAYEQINRDIAYIHKTNYEKPIETSYNNLNNYNKTLLDDAFAKVPKLKH